MIFERFHQAKVQPSDHAKSMKATGLGLAIVSSIVKAHDGECGVECGEGGGSEFWVRLPEFIDPLEDRELMCSSRLRMQTWALVALPLICLVIFVFVLVTHLGSVKKELERESHTRDVLIAIFTTTQRNYELICSAQMNDDLNADPQTKRATANKVVKEFHDEWQKLFKLTANDDYSRKQFDKVKIILYDGLLSFKAWLQESSKESPNKVKIHAMSDRFVAKSKTLLDALQEITVSEEARSKDLKSPALIASVKHSFPASIAITSLAAILLAMFFSNSIRRPLARITENSRLLSRRKPLLPQLTRRDELGDLDRLIHQVAEAIYSALEREQDLLNSVAELVAPSMVMASSRS